MGCPLCHFEFMSNDPEKCKQFYGDVFGWEFNDTSMSDYTLINTGSDPGGGLMKRPDEAPSPCMYAYYLVDNIAETVRKIKDAGGTIHHEETEIPNVGWFAIAGDSEGITFGLFKNK